MITKRLKPAFYACALSSLIAFMPVEIQAVENKSETFTVQVKKNWTVDDVYNLLLKQGYENVTRAKIDSDTEIIAFPSIGDDALIMVKDGYITIAKIQMNTEVSLADINMFNHNNSGKGTLALNGDDLVLWFSLNTGVGVSEKQVVSTIVDFMLLTVKSNSYGFFK